MMLLLYMTQIWRNQMIVAFTCGVLSSYSFKTFCFWYLWSCSLCEGGTCFCTTYLQKTLRVLIYSIDSLYFIWHLTSFSSIKHHFLLWVQLLMLFHLTLMMFSQSTDLLMYWSLETLTFIIRTVKPVLVELYYNASISNDHTQINSPTRIHNCYYHSSAHLDYFFPLNLIFALQWLFLCLKIQIMFFLSFHWIF